MRDADIILDNMKTRRAVRKFIDKPVEDDVLYSIVQAGRFASSGANLRPHRFLITRDQTRIGHIKSFAPGMLGNPAALIAILLDHDQVEHQWVSIDPNYFILFDVGAAGQNMLNAAHALGLGACPVTSYSKSAVHVALGLPGNLSVEMVIMVGHYERKERVVNPDAPKPVTTRELTSWETFGNHDPA